MCVLWVWTAKMNWAAVLVTGIADIDLEVPDDLSEGSEKDCFWFACSTKIQTRRKVSSEQVASRHEICKRFNFPQCCFPRARQHFRRDFHSLDVSCIKWKRNYFYLLTLILRGKYVEFSSPSNLSRGKKGSTQCGEVAFSWHYFDSLVQVSGM